MGQVDFSWDCDASFVDHFKIQALADAMKVKSLAEAGWALVSLYCRARRFAPSGDLSKVSPKTLATWAGNKKLTFKALAEAELIDLQDGDLFSNTAIKVLHGWPERRYVQRDEQRKAAAEAAKVRVKLWRERQKSGDNGTSSQPCAYCGRMVATIDLTTDHVIPQSRGGSNDPINLVPACGSCNAGKSDRDVEEWMRSRGLDYEAFAKRYVTRNKRVSRNAPVRDEADDEAEADGDVERADGVADADAHPLARAITPAVTSPEAVGAAAPNPARCSASALFKKEIFRGNGAQTCADRRASELRDTLGEFSGHTDGVAAEIVKRALTAERKEGVKREKYVTASVKKPWVRDIAAGLATSGATRAERETEEAAMGEVRRKEAAEDRERVAEDAARRPAAAKAAGPPRVPKLRIPPPPPAAVAIASVGIVEQLLRDGGSR